MKYILITIILCILNLNVLFAQIPPIDVAKAFQSKNYEIDFEKNKNRDQYILTILNVNDVDKLTDIKVNSTPITIDKSLLRNKIFSDPNFMDKVDEPAGGLLNGKDFTIEVIYDKKIHTTNVKFKKSEREVQDLSNSQKMEKFIKGKWGAFARKYYRADLNIVLSGKTVHVFLDEKGKFYFSSLPTTAREDYNYQFHFFYIDDGTKDFAYTITGSYDPKFEVYGADDLNLLGGGWETQSTTGVSQPVELQTGNEGPFTETFNVKIQDRKNDKTIIDQSVKVAKTHHISLGVGLFSTLLRDPSDIQKMGIPGTADSTFVANDPKSRGFFSIMATFYPKPRNLLYPSKNVWERFGFTVGTALSKDQFENFFGGLSFDAARGLAIVAGIHYGRRTVISFDNDFDFGSQALTDPNQKIITNEQWNPSIFFGTVIDIRIFEMLFRPSLSK